MADGGVIGFVSDGRAGVVEAGGTSASPTTASRRQRSAARTDGSPARSGRASAATVGRPSAQSLGRPRARSVRVPEVVLGVLLVAGCALAAVIWQQHADTTTTVVVIPPPVGSIVISPPAATIILGQGAQFSAATFDVNDSLLTGREWENAAHASREIYQRLFTPARSAATFVGILQAFRL